MKDFTEEIEKALDVLFKLEGQSKKKNLLCKGKTVYLKVVLFSIPFCPARRRKFLKLKHSLYGDAPDICLFVPNRKTGVEYKKTTDELIDYCVDYYTEFLEKHKVKGITTVMPLKQLRSEYGAYELRRKLVNRFDLFLCKNSLLHNSRFLTSLGKIFKLANKEPFGVPFPSPEADCDPNFQKNIDRAVFTSSFYITRSSDNYSIPIGTLSNTKAELKENLETVLHQISTGDIIPGTLKNIRALYLWPSQSKPIPLYMSSEVPVGVKARVRSRKRRQRAVEGELSTQPGKKVFVTPSGEVFVTNLRRKGKGESEAPRAETDSEDDESFDDGSEEERNKDEEEEEDEKDEVEERVQGQSFSNQSREDISNTFLRTLEDGIFRTALRFRKTAESHEEFQEESEGFENFDFLLEKN